MSQPLHADTPDLAQGAAVLAGPYYDDMTETTRRFEFQTSEPVTTDPNSEMDGVVMKVVSQRVKLTSEMLNRLTNLTSGDTGNLMNLSELLDRCEQENTEQSGGWSGQKS